jgi:hypothetical protein
MNKKEILIYLKEQLERVEEIKTKAKELHDENWIHDLEIKKLVYEKIIKYIGRR